jgi:hypothetical protein
MIDDARNHKREDCFWVCFQMYVYSILLFDDIIWFCYVESVTLLGTKPKRTMYLNPVIACSSGIYP